MSEFSVPQFKDVFANGETTELSGKCIVNLAKGGIILCVYSLHSLTVN